MSGHLQRLRATPAGRPLTPTTNAILPIRHPRPVDVHACERNYIRAHAHRDDEVLDFHSWEWKSRPWVVAAFRC